MPGPSSRAREIFRFELRHHLTSPLFWGTGLFFALMTFGAVTSNSITIGGGIGNVHRNAPFVILQLLSTMSVIAIFVTTAFVGGAALRDFERGTHELFFSKPLGKLEYLGGRFAGSFLASAGVMVLCAAGILLGSFMPWLEPARLGPTTMAPYVFALAVLVLPNLLLAGAIFFALASASRSWLVTYIGVVVFFGAYLTAGLMLADVENQKLGALLDPFGGAALDLATRYWTVAEKNQAVPGFAGPLLWNRVLWSGIGFVILAVAIATFRTGATSAGRSGRPSRLGRLFARRGKAPLREVEAGAPVAAGVSPLPAARLDFSPRARRALFLHELERETLGVLRSVPFLVILAFGMLNVIGGAGVRFERFGTRVYPVTALMLELLRGSFLFLLVIIVTFYAGELVWRERSLKVAEVRDALPVPAWVPLVAKLAAQWLVILCFLAVGAAATMGIQLAHGYHQLEPGLYARGLLLEALPFLLVAVLATFLQVVANQKFFGYLLMIVYLIGATVLDSLHYDHRLYRYAESPSMTYSDMNGYGHFLLGYLSFQLYWAFWALVLAVLAALLWVRGSESGWRFRLREARARFSGPWRALLAIGLIGAAALGAWIFWNTNVRNPYIPTDLLERRQAEYEKRYRKYKDVAVPRVVDVENRVDIYPAERRVEIAGRYVLKNKTKAPIATLHVTIRPLVRVNSLSLDPR
ncbi:MAG TPA: ABC transporter permease, partial [Thermoanaerobaculia bacterium]|nr:ABC transporter permease [Thermoanaerobaculia bacterium]